MTLLEKQETEEETVSFMSLPKQVTIRTVIYLAAEMGKKSIKQHCSRVERNCQLAFQNRNLKV